MSFCYLGFHLDSGAWWLSFLTSCSCTPHWDGHCDHFWWCTDTEEISTTQQQKLTFRADLCPTPDTESFLGAFYDSPSFSNNYFAFQLSSPQPWDRGSLLTAGSEAGALVQCLLNSVGFSQHQKVLDQGWRLWKILPRYGVWSQEIKLVKKGEGEKERKKSIPLKMFLLHFTQHFELHRIFQPLLLSALEKKEKICHVTPKSRWITVSLVRIQMITHLLSFSGALSYHPLSYCILKRITLAVNSCCTN